MRARDAHRKGHELFPHNRHLAHGWARAKLVIGDGDPKVRIGKVDRMLSPRRVRDAVNNADPHAVLAPRTMREAYGA